MSFLFIVLFVLRLVGDSCCSALRFGCQTKTIVTTNPVVGVGCHNVSSKRVHISSQDHKLEFNVGMTFEMCLDGDQFSPE